MERYKFIYPNGKEQVCEVYDKFHFYKLLGEIDKDFIKLYKLNINNQWEEVIDW